MMINRTVLTGRLTDDVDLRYTQSGSAVGNFRLAVNRRFKSDSGQREADFINCVIWQKGAENLANFTHKGSLIGIEGRIQTRNYTNDEGNRVYITEIVVEGFSLLESRNENQVNTGYQQNNFNNQPSNNPFGNANDQVDISDDDLPF